MSLDQHRESPSILFFLEGVNVPASRARVAQYEPVLKSRGVRYRFAYSFPSKYLTIPQFLNFVPLRQLILGVELLVVILTRLVQIVAYSRKYSVIVIQRDLLFRVTLPFLEYFLFWYARLGATTPPRCIFDIDDAIFLDKNMGEGSPQSRKIASILKHCSFAIAGNNYLSTWCAHHTKSVVVPTTVDTNTFITKSGEASPLCIGWTGVRSNLPYLASFEDLLNKLAADSSFQFSIICEAGTPSPFKAPRFPVNMIAWSESRFPSELSRFDIGLMPLPDDPWTRGKCGYKILQYMAAGVPVIASRVGVNPEIISESINGLLAATPAEWLTALQTLYRSPELRKTLRTQGLQTVKERYSSQVWGGTWLEILIGTDA